MTPDQVYAYDAYGLPVGFDLAAALTTHLYSGERTDQLTGLQYLRARYYNPATGTFNRLDPFAGNFSDPQSLHKYLYTHADPVNGWDPSGESVIGSIVRKVLKSRWARRTVEATVYAITKAMIGTRVSYILGYAYIAENGRDSDEVRINNALARLADDDLPIDRDAEGFAEQMEEWQKSKPDIVDHTIGEEQFYEIKPEADAAAGRGQLTRYESGLQSRYPGTTFARGNWQPQQRIYTIDSCFGLPVPLHIEAWNSEPGLILYRSTGNEDNVLKAVIMAEVIAEAAFIGAKAGATGVGVANSARAQGHWAAAMLVSVMIGF